MKYQAIADEINKMTVEDQRVREEFYSRNSIDQELFDKLVKPVDEANYRRISEIIEEIGYPTKSKVGKQASFNTWLIIQHHPEGDFQKKCLELMEAENDDVDPQNIAYLKDRVLMFSGKKQVYGTQLRRNKYTKKMELYEVEDVEHLNEKRKSVGLEPIEEYLKSFE